MKHMKSILSILLVLVCSLSIMLVSFMEVAAGADLPEIKKKGVLRHLGVPYANFVTGSGDGLDVELVRLFAQHLGVQYQYVGTTWDDVIGDLTGKKVHPRGENVEILGEVPIRGDIIANGLTILPWRQKVVDFSTPLFPSQVWLIAQADSPLQPITPSNELDRDVAEVKALLKGHSTLGKVSTCLDPSLYDLEKTGARVKLFGGELNELAPAIINGEAELTLLDVPDALIALEKWPGQIKVIGPISPFQNMGYAFATTSPELRDAFNTFFEQCRQDGTYARLVKKYYPAVYFYYPSFFEED